MFNLFARISFNQVAFVSTFYQIADSSKNILLYLKNIAIGHEDRVVSSFHPLDLDEHALTDEEQAESDKRELLLNMSSAGLCIVNAYTIATGQTSTLDTMVSGCIIAKTGYDLGTQAYHCLSAPTKLKRL